MNPHFRALALVAGALVLASASASRAVDAYEPGPDAERQPAVPEGRVESFEFTESRVFPGTTRSGWVYVPSQYRGDEPAALMVFQDGHAYVNVTPGGRVRAPVVMDNLIARGEMPVTLGLFINPGHRGAGGPDAAGWGNRNNRSIEYDSLGDAYARFLSEDLIPFVARKWNLNISGHPAHRALVGISSGGICAWTAAWERPGEFGKVISHIGSFVNIRGGHVYPALIRKTPRKDVRVYLQEGSNDLNNEHGDWPLANLQMAKALAFAGYDHRLDWGDGAHNDRHGGAAFPEALRWLWRAEAPIGLKSPASPVGVEALFPATTGGWELVGEGYAFTDAACADAEGNFFFSDLPRGTLYRVPAAGGAPEVWLKDGPRISGMKFGPDGKLYACVQGVGTNSVKSIACIDPATRAVTTVATGVQPNDLVVTRGGWIYFTQTAEGQVVRVPTSARGLSRPPPVAGGIVAPNGIGLDPTERVLWVSEYQGTNLWRFSLEPDGSISGGERRAVLAAAEGRKDSGGDGAAVDAAGRVVVTSHLGLQVFDAEGRPVGVVPRPQDRGTVSCAWAGREGLDLYVCSSDRVYRRRVARVP